MAFSGFLAHVHDVFANFNLILKGWGGGTGFVLFCFGERGWVGSQRNRWCKSDKLVCYAKCNLSLTAFVILQNKPCMLGQFFPRADVYI